MTDDIVTRLRLSVITDASRLHSMIGDAADEIERLRQLSNGLLEALRDMADKEMLPKITVLLRDAAQALEQAVRGE